MPSARASGRVGGAELPIEESERASFGLQVTSLEALAAQLYDSVDFKSILCDSTTGLISPEGEGIPFTIGTAASSHPNMCGKATAYPDADGLYEFSEAHNMVYLAYQQACGAQRPGQCNYTNIELMWNRWQKRRNSPNHHYTNYPILSTSGGYMLQMLYYTTNSFNNDTRYQELFHNHWLADESFYKQALYAGKRGRYGLGEGPESKWCNEQKSYNSLHLHEKNQKKRSELDELADAAREVAFAHAVLEGIPHSVGILCGLRQQPNRLANTPAQREVARQHAHVGALKRQAALHVAERGVGAGVDEAHRRRAAAADAPPASVIALHPRRVEAMSVPSTVAIGTW